MESKKIRIGNYDISYYCINTLVIGSGAASLNAAASLHSMGQDNILIATAEFGGGTSNNAGSDKQTYYKLSLAGDEPDSTLEMAKDLFSGHCMHGDIALCEAQGSVRAFMNLVNLGVPFPHNDYGAFPGYKTDHDPRARGTSAGPYTSKLMFSKLADEVRRRGIRILDRHQVVTLFTDKTGSKVTGALAINTEEKDATQAFVLINAVNIILGTGGPGGIYESSVYPETQKGSTGMAFRAGATGHNLTESQFGIASLKFRWNLSGSYQQVVPGYFSTDREGRNKRDFLNESFPDYTSLTRAIFLKGYQWPFDSQKIKDHGSSLIDLLVFRETVERGRRVYVDYRNNPGWESAYIFRPELLDPVVREYLEKSGAMKLTPLERLEAMNKPALQLFQEHGIDLAKEPLEVAVCVQHNNGGLKGNIWWESDLRNLFPVGEVNGAHGVYRPGGSALNSGQVGSFRAAQYIAARHRAQDAGNQDFLNEVSFLLNEELKLADKWLTSGKSGQNERFLSDIRKRMSWAANIIRNLKRSEQAASEAYDLLLRLNDHIGAGSVKELADCFILRDHCFTHYIYLKAVETYIREGGRSRGSYIVTCAEISDMDFELCNYDRDIEKDILEIRYTEGEVKTNLMKVREIPLQNLWFEEVWKDYIKDNLPGS
ncbi:MAG: FAD-binding protein [Bacteroidota bacterium]|nr:FAD-binding protein [Bacteroidota bacterium]